MRRAFLLGAMLLFLTPTAQAASEGLSLSGPATLRLDGPATATLLLALQLDGVVCTGPAEIAVDLSLSRASGVDASLSSGRIVFRVAPHAAVRSWSGEAHIDLDLAPRETLGIVELLASYRLPSQCRAVGGPASGDARHSIRIEEPTADEPASLGSAEPIAIARAEPTALPWGVQAAIVATCAGGVLVLVQRVRAR